MNLESSLVSMKAYGKRTRTRTPGVANCGGNGYGKRIPWVGTAAAVLRRERELKWDICESRGLDG